LTIFSYRSGVQNRVRVRKLSLIALDQFAEQFANLNFCCFERPLPERCRPVHLAPRLALPFFRGAQVTLSLQPVEQWIQSTRTDPIAVARQLLRHSQAEHRP